MFGRKWEVTKELIANLIGLSMNINKSFMIRKDLDSALENIVKYGEGEMLVKNRSGYALILIKKLWSTVLKVII